MTRSRAERCSGLNAAARETRCQSDPDGEKDRQPDEQRRAGNVNPGNIPIAIRQHCCRDLAAAREDDHAAAVHRQRSEGGDYRWDPKDGNQQSVHDAERASDRASEEDHKEDPPVRMMLQPFGGDECTRRDHGANREIDLSGNYDDGFAKGNDAYESGR